MASQRASAAGFTAAAERIALAPPFQIEGESPHTNSGLLRNFAWYPSTACSSVRKTSLSPCLREILRTRSRNSDPPADFTDALKIAARESMRACSSSESPIMENSPGSPDSSGKARAILAKRLSIVPMVRTPA